MSFKRRMGLWLSSLAVLSAMPLVADDRLEPLGTQDFHFVDSQLANLAEELLSGNPEIRAARESSLASLQRVPQAQSLPDPQVSYRVFLGQPETRVGPQRQGVEINQGIPWGGKRQLQAERASHNAASLSWRVRDLERSLVAELKRVYLEAAYLQEALAINADERSLLERFEQIALTRYATGEGIQQSVIKVQTDISRLTDQRIALNERLTSIERRIAVLLGRPERDLTLEPIELAPPKLAYSREALEQEAIERNPAVLADRKRIDADNAWVRRRQRDTRPDFAVGVGYIDVGKREDLAGIVSPPQGNGSDVWALSVKLNIPLQRKRIRAGVTEAEHSLAAGRHALERAQDRLAHGVQDSLIRIESLAERTRLYGELLIPQAEESLASSEAAYTTNRQTFLDLLDAERVLFQVRLMYHRLLADYWIALADMEKTVARPFPNRLEIEEGTS